MGILALLVVATFRDYGVSYDEWVHARYGQLILRYYASGFVDQGALTFFTMYLYGGAFDMAVAWLASWLPLPAVDARHLVHAFVGLLGVYGTYKVGRLVFGETTGVLAALLLALLPAYYGHLFNNPTDIPFATGYVWSLYFLLRVTEELPRVRLGLLVALGTVIGLTLGVRIGGLMLLAYFLGTTLVHVLWIERPTRGAALRIGAALVCTGVVAYAWMLLAWPWAQADPLVRPLQALRTFTHFTAQHEHLAIQPRYLFAGRVVPLPELPRLYLPIHFVLQLPVLFWPFLVLGLWHGTRSVRVDRRWTLRWGLVVVAAAFPPAYIVLRHSQVFDGIRHVTFILPPMAIIAALGVRRFWEIMRARVSMRWLATGGLALYLLHHGFMLVVLHPYQYTYYSELIGGLPGASGRFETDYWAHSYREAVMRLRTWLRETGDTGGPYVVEVCGPRSAAAPFFGDDFVLPRGEEKPDFSLAFTRLSCHLARQGPVVVQVERLGVPLSVVRDLRAR